MPSEYHPQHCTCRECRFPAEQNVLEPVLLSLGAILALMLFSFAVIFFIRLLTGAGQ
jgi:hypothetical protein